MVIDSQDILYQNLFGCNIQNLCEGRRRDVQMAELLKLDLKLKTESIL